MADANDSDASQTGHADEGIPTDQPYWLYRLAIIRLASWATLADCKPSFAEVSPLGPGSWQE
jgi:hypothetical protein